MKPIQVQIFEQKDNAKLCAEECGVNWLTPEPQQEARERLQRAFGQGVKIDFLNLDEPGVRQEHGEWLNRVKKEGLLLPLLVIDGEVRISGFFDLRMLYDMVDADRELRRG